jgi:hypothetical protein
MYKITPYWVTLHQPAGWAAVLGQPSSLRPHWSGNASPPPSFLNSGLFPSLASLCGSLQKKPWIKQRHYIFFFSPLQEQKNAKKLKIFGNPASVSCCDSCFSVNNITRQQISYWDDLERWQELQSLIC